MPRTAILGATGTIGSLLARRLSELGHDLALLGRDGQVLSTLSQDVQQPSAIFDPRSSASLEDAIRTATAGDECNAIVNCIGSVLLKPAHATSDDEFREVVETNLFTSFAAIRAAGRLMQTGGGAVLLFASAAAEIGLQNHEAIAAAKSGVIGLARSAAATYSPANIRVNCISPGLVRTKLTQRIWANPAGAKASAELHALGRLGEPEHVVSLAVWLLDPANDWMTGQVIGLDGGLSRVVPKRR